MIVVSVSPIVGLKHPPALAPTVPATVARVIPMVRAPSMPDEVAAEREYFVCTITEMKMNVKMVCSMKTWNMGIVLVRGLRIKGFWSCCKPIAINIPQYAPIISAIIVTTKMGRFFFHFISTR